MPDYRGALGPWEVERSASPRPWSPGLGGGDVGARPESLLLPSQPQSGVRQAGEREDGDAAPLCDGEEQPAAGRREGRAGQGRAPRVVGPAGTRPEPGPASGQPPGVLPFSAAASPILGGGTKAETNPHSWPPL